MISICLIACFLWKRTKQSSKNRALGKGNGPNMASRAITRILWLRDCVGNKHKQHGWVSMDDSPAPKRHSFHAPGMRHESTTFDTRFGPSMPRRLSVVTSPMGSVSSTMALDHDLTPSIPSLPGQYETGPCLSFNAPAYMTRQSSLSLQPPHLHDNRISDLSSALSSGFGDRDIIIIDSQAVHGSGQDTTMPQPQPQLQLQLQLQHPVPIHTPLMLKKSFYRMSRFSWASQGFGTGDGDTMCKQGPPSPPRFRSVGDWVGQQTGRLQRAQGEMVGGKSGVEEQDGGAEL